MPRSRSLTERGLSLAASASSSCVSPASARNRRSSPPKPDAACSATGPSPPHRPGAARTLTRSRHRRAHPLPTVILWVSCGPARVVTAPASRDRGTSHTRTRPDRTDRTTPCTPTPTAPPARPRPAPRHVRRHRPTPPGPPAPRPGQHGPARPDNPAPPAPRLAPGPASARPRLTAPPAQRAGSMTSHPTTPTKGNEMSTETETAVQSATGHPQLVEPVARLHVPALIQPQRMWSP